MYTAMLKYRPSHW